MTAFVDTAVLMYAAGGEHPLRAPSQRVLERVEEGELDAVISVEVVQEIVHRYLAIRRPDLAVTGATAAMDLFAPVLPLTHAIMRRLPALARDYPKLAARDLIHVAVCQQEGIGEIISPDRGFDTVAGLRRIDPADLQLERIDALLASAGSAASGTGTVARDHDDVPAADRE